jgi:hypothetical protein
MLLSPEQIDPVTAFLRAVAEPPAAAERAANG